MTRDLNGILQFGPYKVDCDQRLLTRENEIISLAPKIFDTLLALVGSGGRVFEKENLLKTVWPDAFVEEGSLARNISTLRKVLGDNSHDQKYIVTVPKRGYRFIARVTATAAAGEQSGISAKGDQASWETPAVPISLNAESRTFVGRTGERQRLGKHFERMLARRGHVVFLTGEAGIGKSALADDFVNSVSRQRPGVMIARGRAVEQYGTGESYLPFLDALSVLLREYPDSLPALLRVHAPTWCLHVPAFHASGDLDQLRHETAGATKDRMLREMGDALSALSSNAPLLLILEDLHWADPPTVDLLRYLSHRISAQQVLLLITVRPEHIEIQNHPLKNCKIEMQAHQQCEEISLQVLSAGDIAELIDSKFTPNEFPDELPRLIRTRTDGQPLFTVSLLEFLRERGDIAQINSHWRLTKPLCELDLEIPADVRAMIRKKSEALDPESRRVLQYASVLGEEFLSTVVANLLERDELTVEEQLAVLAQTYHLIEVQGEEELPDGALATRYAFAHALYQNVFYDELVTKRRALLHARAGEQLLRHYGDCKSRIALQLAIHFERGRDWAKATELLILAGVNARSMYANAQAAEHYTHALELAAKLPPGTSADTEFRIYQERAAVHLATSHFDASIADCKDMIDRARMIGSPALEYVALYTLGNILFWAHRLHEMQSVLEEVVRLAENTGSEQARLQALALMAQGHLALGKLDDAERESREVVECTSVVDKQTRLEVLDVRARLAYFQSEYCKAEKMFRETLTAASELGNGFEMLKAQYFLSLTLANLGRISEAIEMLRQGMQMAERNGDFFWSSRVPNAFGWIHRELQDFEAAVAFNREGAETARRLGVTEAEVNSLINMGMDHVHAGEWQASFSAMKSAESILSQDPWFRWRFEIRFHAARAERSLSKDEGLSLLKKATHCRSRKYMIAAQTILARIAMDEGDTASAEAQLNAAVRLLSEFPAPLIAWKTYSMLGRLHTQLGNQDAACAAFGEATSLINYLSDHISDERLCAIFLNSQAVQEAASHSALQVRLDLACGKLMDHLP